MSKKVSSHLLSQIAIEKLMLWLRTILRPMSTSFECPGFQKMVHTNFLFGTHQFYKIMYNFGQLSSRIIEGLKKGLRWRWPLSSTPWPVICCPRLQSINQKYFYYLSYNLYDYRLLNASWGNCNFASWKLIAHLVPGLTIIYLLKYVDGICWLLT